MTDPVIEFDGHTYRVVKYRSWWVWAREDGYGLEYLRPNQPLIVNPVGTRGAYDTKEWAIKAALLSGHLINEEEPAWDDH
jgi:hypothetical protein